MKTMTKKVLACLLTLAMLFTMAVPFTAFAADEPTGYEGQTKTYYAEEGKTFDGTENGDDKSDDVGIGNGAGSIHFSCTVQVSTPPEAGSKYTLVEFSQDTNNYISVYVASRSSDSKPQVGCDIYKNGTAVKSNFYYTMTGAGANLFDGSEHTVEFEFNKGVSYVAIANGEEHTTTETSVDFNATRGMTFNKLIIGGSIDNTSKFIGTMKNVKIENCDVPPIVPVAVYDGNTKEVPDEDITKIKEMNQGAIGASYKIDEAKNEDITLFAIGSEALTVNPTTGAIKFDGVTVTVADTKRTSDTNQWHSVIAAFDGTNVKFYFDGTAVGNAQAHEGIFSENSTTAEVGKNVANVTIFSNIDDDIIAEYTGETGAAIIEDSLYDFSREVPTMVGDEKSDYYRIPGLTQAGNVTIAVIDERKGGSGDQGAIDLQVRRSFDNGNTWEDAVTVSSLGKPVGCGLGGQQPLHIDPSVTFDDVNDRIYILVDMFPQSSAAMAMDLISDGSGFDDFTLEDGSVVRMQILNSEPKGGRTNAATGTPSATNIVYGLLHNIEDDTAEVYEPVTQNGQTVYKKSNTYFVSDYSYGTLVKDPTNSGNFDEDNVEDAGNIFVYTTATAGQLTVECTMYVWMYTSDDFGKTWSNPTNISGFEGCKQDWMRFCATTPGSGIVIRGGDYDGRIVVPCYFTNNASTGLASQSSAAFYSDDHGKTWKIGKSVNEIRLNTTDDNAIATFQNGNQTTENAITQVNKDGKLRIYCRNTGGYGKVVSAVSNDGGETWEAPDGQVSGSAGANNNYFPSSCYEEITEVYCMLAAITYKDPNTGKYYSVISNPMGPSGRKNLGIHVRELDYETGDFVAGSSWITKQVGDTNEAYSSLTTLANGNIGLYWEMERIGVSYDIAFQQFTMDYLLGNQQFYPTETLEITKEVINGDGNAAGMIEAGDTIVFKLKTHDPVYIKGTPKIKVNIGGTLGTHGTTIEGGKVRYATYCGGSGTNQIEFAYTLRANDQGSICAYSEIYSDDENVAENALGAIFTTVAPRYTNVGNTGMDAQDATHDIDYTTLTAEDGSHQAEDSVGAKVLDNDPTTIWHTSWTGTNYDNLWITLKKSDNSQMTVNGLRYQPRQNGTNGYILEYEIYLDKAGNGDFEKVTEGTWANNSAWKAANFPATEVYAVKLKVTKMRSDSQYTFASAAEMRLTTPPEDSTVTPSTVDKTMLETMITGATAALNGASDEKKAALNEVIDAANTVKNNNSATQMDVEDAIDALQEAIDIDDNAADKTELADKIDEAEAAFSAAIDDAKREALTLAIAVAAGVKNYDGATQKLVDDAIEALETAMAQEDTKPSDKTELVELLAQAVVILPEVTDAEKLAALEDAIYWGFEVNDYYKRADQNMVDDAVARLREAIPEIDPEPEYSLGNVDHSAESDGTETINATDATFVLQYFAKIITDESDVAFDKELADVNADKEVNATDATLILQYFAKIITSFPAENAQA